MARKSEQLPKFIENYRQAEHSDGSCAIQH